MWDWWVKHGPDIIKLLSAAAAIIAPIAKLLKKYHAQRKAQMEQLQEEVKKLKENDEKQRRTNLSLLHNEIYKQCKEYIAQGRVGITDLQNLDKMYAAYAENDGNGTAKTLVEEVHKLKKES